METKTESTPSHTNVDYLLENFTVNEIIDIQSKLKLEVERKKQDLKHLVGERYRDLMEAVDTIKQMNDCSDSVLNSLVVLNKSQSKYLLTSNHSSDERNVKNSQQMASDCETFNKYKAALLLRLIVDMPLNIWNAIDSEDLVRATYYYFYGQHFCSLFQQMVATDRMPKLFDRFRTAINRFKDIIVKKCWNSNKKSSLNDYFDDSSNADTFCCLLLLQNSTPKQLFDTILEKRKSDTKECFNGSKDLRSGLQTFLNLLFNTIKCIHSIFYKNNGLKAKTLLHQRFERMKKISFDSSLLKDFVLSEDFKFRLSHIRDNLSIDSIESEYIQNETKNWISFIKSSVEPLLKNLLEPIDSVHNICVVLNEINENLKQTQKLGRNFVKNLWLTICRFGTNSSSLLSSRKSNQ